MIIVIFHSHSHFLSISVSSIYLIHNNSSNTLLFITTLHTLISILSIHLHTLISLTTLILTRYHSIIHYITIIWRYLLSTYHIHILDPFTLHPLNPSHHPHSLLLYILFNSPSSIHSHSSIVLINSIPFFHSFLFQFNKSLHDIMYSTIINFLSLSRPYSIPLPYTSFHILFLIVSISYNWYSYWFGLIWMIEHNKFISVQRVILMLLMFMKELIHCEE